jgi:hypothetical protein
MPTIKGPIKFKGGFNAKEFLAKKGTKVKLPFEATGFKSSKIPESADLSGIKFDKDAKVKKVKKSEKKDLSLDTLDKIKGIGKKRLKDIKRAFNSIEDLKKALEEDKVPLRDDVVEKLKKELK